MRVGIIGASGYTGGELLRVLLSHPEVEVTTAISREYAGKYIFRVHPNLRGLTTLRFDQLDVERFVERCDAAFLATPHGVSKRLTPRLLETGLKVIDLSADFRLKKSDDYQTWYGWEHPAKELLEEAVYGLPELHRVYIKKARLVACPGCIAVSAILALAPVVKANIVDEKKIVIDSKIGSTGAGSKPSLSTHHPERYGVVRPYRPVGHRHTAEVEQELSAIAGREVRVSLSCHAVNIVRGILSTVHGFLKKDVQLVDVWKMFREFYRGEPFVRLVREKGGIYRLPDPKVVIGSNYCDIGFELDERNKRLVTISAIDNLMAGAAGKAVQCMNIMLGVDERTGLEAAGFHPL